MRTLILFIFCLYCTNAAAQNNTFTIGVGSSVTSRILYFPEENFSNNEINELKELEVIKPSFQGEVGYFLRKDKAISFRVGIGYRHTRFGSKIYKIPPFAPNVTPQYSRKKEVIRQNQKFIFLETNFNKLAPLKSSATFFKIMFIHNNKHYTMYEPSYDYNNKKTFVGTRGGEIFKFHQLDLNISLGLKYHLFKNAKHDFILQPYVSAFVRPYRVIGEQYYYLYFNKNTKGFIWDFGLLVQYPFHI